MKLKLSLLYAKKRKITSSVETRCSIVIYGRVVEFCRLSNLNKIFIFLLVPEF